MNSRQHNAMERTLDREALSRAPLKRLPKPGPYTRRLREQVEDLRIRVEKLEFLLGERK